MKLRYLSDLHIELMKSFEFIEVLEKIIPNKDEICILPGDIGDPYSENYDIFMDYINDSFKKTFVIAGNHEYYNNKNTIDETNKFLVDYFKQYSNITFLNNTFEYYEGYCFVGTTLWSHIVNPEFTINDIYAIKDFGYIKYNSHNKICVSFLEETIKNNNNLIIITHHVPSNDLIDIKYKVSSMISYNQWFYCNLDYLINENKDKIKCWIYGHTHIPSFKFINNIPFLCNPIGYQNENIHTNFTKTFIL
jgi:predicted phosphodiesterase